MTQIQLIQIPPDEELLVSVASTVQVQLVTVPPDDEPLVSLSPPSEVHLALMAGLPQKVINLDNAVPGSIVYYDSGVLTTDTINTLTLLKQIDGYDVTVTSPLNNQALIFNSSNSTWENVSLDLTYVTLATTQTISGDKTFTGIMNLTAANTTVYTQLTSDSSTKAASTAFVQARSTEILNESNDYSDLLAIAMAISLG
jgi:hypothetical protein